MSEQYGRTWRNVRDGAISYGNPAHWTLTAKDDWERVHVLNDAELAAHDRQVKAEALREAADAKFYDGDRDRPLPGYDYLHARADRIESQEAP